MQSGKKQNLGLLALRVSVGLTFLIIGWDKLNDLERTINLFEWLEFTGIGFFAGILALTQFLGGIALILGIYIRLAAKLLSIAMIAALLYIAVIAALLAVPTESFHNVITIFILLGNALAIMFLGGGDWQLMKDKECVGMCKVCK